MPVLDKKDFQKVLAQVEAGTIAPLYLLHGEDYLVKSALAQLTEILVPESQRSTNLEMVDGSQADFRQILDSVNTYALCSGGGRRLLSRIVEFSTLGPTYLHFMPRAKRHTRQEIWKLRPA